MKSYHNLLGIRKEEREQSFYFDGNVTAMEKTNTDKRANDMALNYFMLDEQGSPLRVSSSKVHRYIPISCYIMEQVMPV